MSVSLVVPYRPGIPERDAAWAWLRARHEHHHPDWEIVEADTPGPWNKPAAVNRAVDQAHGDVLVVIDADLAPHPDALNTAIGHPAPWVVPFDTVNRLDATTTREVLTRPVDDPLDDQWTRRQLWRAPYHGVPGGGVFVLARAVYLEVGGMDERFVGWGGEDRAFGQALTVLVGPPAQYDTPAVHLWHPTQTKTNHMSDASTRLARRYQRADRQAMLTLVEEHHACRSPRS